MSCSPGIRPTRRYGSQNTIGACQLGSEATACRRWSRAALDGCLPDIAMARCASRRCFVTAGCPSRPCTLTRASSCRPDLLRQLFTEDLTAHLGQSNATALRRRHHCRSCDRACPCVSRASYADLRFGLLDGILVKVDRMSMAHSLEVRSPLLDHRLVEFAARLAAIVQAAWVADQGDPPRHRATLLTAGNGAQGETRVQSAPARVVENRIARDGARFPGVRKRAVAAGYLQSCRHQAVVTSASPGRGRSQPANLAAAELCDVA